MKIIHVITFRLWIIFPEISWKFPEILNVRKIYNPSDQYALAADLGAAWRTTRRQFIQWPLSGLWVDDDAASMTRSSSVQFFVHKVDDIIFIDITVSTRCVFGRTTAPRVTLQVIGYDCMMSFVALCDAKSNSLPLPLNTMMYWCVRCSSCVPPILSRNMSMPSMETKSCFCCWTTLLLRLHWIYAVSGKKWDQNVFVISLIKRWRFWWNLVHRFLNKFAAKLCKQFPPHLNNVSTLRH